MFRIVHKQIYKIEQILPLIDSNREGRIMLDGDWVNICSARLQTFKYKGTICANCGLEGAFFRKEKDIQSCKDRQKPEPRRCHLNLYAVNYKYEPVLMTKDHIIPRCKGGVTTLENLQPMCAPCNNEKGNRIL
jgi:5-methylcytosine-specific restriction endonuclease McrA